MQDNKNFFRHSAYWQTTSQAVDSNSHRTAHQHAL